MAITLTSTEYDEIRLAISGDLDADDLTDAQIDGSLVLGAAEGYVMQRIPGGSTGLNTAETRGYRRSILYRCAWILVPSFPDQVAETEGPLSARYQGTPMEQKRAFLAEQTETEIEKLVDAGHGKTDETFMPAVAVFTID